MNPYSDRRAALQKHMLSLGGGVAILSTSLEMTRNSDCFFPFRHDSYFYYLTGFSEPEAVLVLVAGEQCQSILFCREKNPEREIWDGFMYGPDAAKEKFGFDAAYKITELDQHLPDLLADVPAIFHSQGYHNHLDSLLQVSIQVVKGKSRSGIRVPSHTADLHAILDEMRLIKDASEIALMQRAANITSVAHRRAMQITCPGMFEYELEAEMLHEFRRSGAQSPAYGPIVAAGANACILHYSANNAKIKDGDLILIDAGCEFDSYASDVTRTFPANGKFSEPQKAIYELVLASQHAALEHARVGARYIDGHNAAVRILTEGMIEIGLLDKNKVGSVEDAIASAAYRQFYMHGTGHWIGMDVHDVGNYREMKAAPDSKDKPHRVLQAGMALTIEPGIYVRPDPNVPERYWNIGIRIEDDVVITEKGPLNLSVDAPKTVHDIEAVMKSINRAT